MNIPPKIKPIIYGVGVFAVFNIFVIILKLMTQQVSADAEYFGLITNNDLLLGLIVAIVLTFSHERKKKLKE